MSDLSTLRVQIAALNDADYRELFAWMGTTEQTRRAAVPLVQEAEAEMVRELRKQQVGVGGVVKGESGAAWVRPVTKLGLYILGDRVEHQGVQWEAVAASTDQEPGAGADWVKSAGEQGAAGPVLESKPTGWVEGETFGEGATVSHAGDWWKATKETSEEPGRGSDWVKVFDETEEE